MNMKKIIFSGLLALLMFGVNAQDIKSIQKLLEKKDVAGAKTQIDAFTAKEPNNPIGLWYKSKVYGMIAMDDQLKTTVPDARQISYDAFQKAITAGAAAGSTNKEYMLLSISKDFYTPIFDLYTGWYQEGATYFNTGASGGNKAAFEQSMNAFKNSDMVGHYIYTNKWSNSLSAIDTVLTLNIAKAALNAGKKDEAMVYFKKIADANIRGTKDDNNGYILPYEWLSAYYKDAKDSVNFMKYSSLGMQFFPKEDYFDALMLDYYRAKKDYPSLYKKYDEVIVKYPDSLMYHFNYANDMFNNVYNGDAGTKLTNKDALMKTIGSELQKASAINANDVNTNWLNGQYYFNTGVDIKEQANAIKSTKPEDIKKKADLNAQAKTQFSTALPYVEKAMAGLETTNKKSDKSRYKSIADLMQRVYSGLQQPDKVKMYQAKYDAADAVFVK